MRSIHTRTSANRRLRRSGFTLTEVLVALVLLGFVMGTMMLVLIRQQRFYRSANEIIDTRTQVRQAIAMLPNDLRTISTSDSRNDTDIYEASDKAIELRSIFGSSIICKKISVSQYVLPPVDVAKGTALTVWSREPVVGDSVLVFDDSTSVGSDDDHWENYKITAVSTLAATATNACPTTSGFVQAADVTAGKVSYLLTVDAPPSQTLSGTIGQGAPIRFFRRRRYELYQPSGSTSWYLGRTDCDHNGNVCPGLSPVSGPFAAYSTTVANSGLSFIYWKSDGTTFTPTTALASKQQIAGIQIVARADTKTRVTIAGMANEVKRDSLSLNISLRNTK
jgi:prepilin-type N-terminal cleavage/methylation domain-containing protein